MKYVKLVWQQSANYIINYHSSIFFLKLDQYAYQHSYIIVTIILWGLDIGIFTSFEQFIRY